MEPVGKGVADPVRCYQRRCRTGRENNPDLIREGRDGQPEYKEQNPNISNFRISDKSAKVPDIRSHYSMQYREQIPDTRNRLPIQGT